MGNFNPRTLLFIAVSFHRISWCWPARSDACIVGHRCGMKEFLFTFSSGGRTRASVQSLPPGSRTQALFHWGWPGRPLQGKEIGLLVTPPRALAAGLVATPPTALPGPPAGQIRSGQIGGPSQPPKLLWTPHNNSISTSYWSVSPAPTLPPPSPSSRTPACLAPAPSWSKRLTGGPNVGKLSHSLNAHIPFSLLRLVSHLIFNLPCVHPPVKTSHVTIIKNKTSSNS